MKDPILHFGLLGWSNKRTGLEFYRYDEKIIPRHESEWGDLLVAQMDDAAEGCPVLVVAMPRATTQDEMFKAGEAVLGALGEE
jgi:hypothetical protein